MAKDKDETSAPEAAAAEPKAPKVEQNGVTRPKAGTGTGRIWEIADEQSAKAGAPAPRKAVLDQAAAEGLNGATAATQYGRWRKFHGLGRETPAAEAAPASDSTVE